MGSWWARIKAPWWALAAVASVITMILAGAVGAVATPAGCKVAQGAGLPISIGDCHAKSVSSPVAEVSNSPSPTFVPTSAAPTYYPYTPPPSAPLPPQATPSPLPPYEYPPSAGMPPYTFTSSAPLPSNITFTCRLPIYVGPSGSGGFIVFPGGSFVADPRSNVTLPTGLPSPNPGNGGYGFQFGLSYDHVHGRWFPMRWDWAAPDGSRYAYPGPQGLYVINAADGSFIELGQGKAWNILSVDAQGVYATVQNAAGLWLLPFTGSEQQITATGYWQAVGGGAAYGTSTSAVPSGVSNQILRLDLKTGATAIWFMADGGQSTVIGFDNSGSPFIMVNAFVFDQYNGIGSYLWLVPSVGGAKPISAVGGNQSTFTPNWPPIAGQQGVWFGAGQGIFLFVHDTGLFRVSAIGGQLAGDCA